MTFIERIDGWLNPIMVKELRQAVRGRFIMTVLSLSLLAQIAAVSGFLLTQSIDPARAATNPVGGTAFITLFVVLFTATVIFIPLYSGIRMAVERSDSNVDLLFVTTIRPRTIVIGKLLTTIVLTALVFFVSLPFLVFSYVLRGVDVLAILVVLAFAFVAVCSSGIVALFLGCIPASKPFRIVLGLIFLLFILFVYGSVMTMLGAFLGSGTTAMFASSDFWAATLIALGLIGGLDAMLLITTATIVTPPSANRALPIRLMTAVIWALSLGAAAAATFRRGNMPPITIWAVTMLVLVTIVLSSAIGERDRWGPRVARAIPSNPFKRTLAFLFYSGAGGGILWAALFFGLTTAAYAIVLQTRPAPLVNDSPAETRLFAEAALCLLFYTLAAAAIRRRFLPKIPARATWAVALILFLLLAVAPPLIFLAAFSGTPDFAQRYNALAILNPFPAFSGDASVLRLPLLAALAILAFAANASWIAEQWRAFRRFEGPAESDAPALQEGTAA